MIKNFDTFVLESNNRIIDEDVTIVIRKNNDEIKNKLEEIGYKETSTPFAGRVFPYLCVRNTFRKIGGERPCYSGVAEDAPLFKINDTIDCGDNEELFFKLARLLFNINAHMM
jgi:hypothetical protein